MYLREHRLARRLTILQLADLVGVSPALIGHYETGFRAPTANARFVIADALGLDLFDLSRRPQVVGY
jgi:transcriptional regulator with XRE-family HTH domain